MAVIERVERIEEDKMILKLIGKFLLYAIGLGIVHLTCMAFCFITGFFFDGLGIFGSTIMIVLTGFINFGLIYFLSKGATEKAFDTVTPVKAPVRSRRRILLGPAVIILIVMMLVMFINTIVLHSLFTEKITSDIYYIYNDTSDMEVIKTQVNKDYGIVNSIRKVEDGIYCAKVKSYPADVVITFGIMTGINLLLAVWGILNENKLLKRYLIE